MEPALARALDPAIRSEEGYRYRITRPDTGEERWLQAHGGAVFESGRAIRYTGTLQDVTDDVAVARRLEDEQARLQLALSAAGLAIWELDVGTNQVTASQELNRLYRFADDAKPSIEELQALYGPGERERVEAESARTFAGGNKTIRFEAKHQWPDGVVKWISVRAQIVTDGAGVPTRVIGVAMDVTERHRYEENLRLTALELQHRVKNTLTVVQSIAAQSFRGPRTKAEGLEAFTGRLHALAAATDLLTQSNWKAIAISDIVEETIRPFRSERRDRFIIEGDTRYVPSNVAVNLGMALHELSTNAVKYGALSGDYGSVAIGWQTIAENLVIDWRESGGPVVSTQGSGGFGTKLLTRGLFDSVTGSTEFHFEPGGVHCIIKIRSSVLPAASSG
ncbi:MAG: HWE histidine kinase domain-containing protein [Devosia sp.]